MISGTKNGTEIEKIRIPVRFDTPETRATGSVRELLKEKGLRTVCEEATCPNLHHCWSSGTATFLIMGGICTRNCSFCDIHPGRPEPLETDEPEKLARAVEQMGLRHAVITSVTRDDLPDGGSQHFAATIRAVKKRNPDVTVEVLIPDFRGNREDLDRVLSAGPHILNHNLETVPSLYQSIRPQANYRRSLELLEYAARKGFNVKSGIMLGMGETEEEVHEVLKDLSRVGCRIVTMGQYLAPTENHAPIKRYLTGEEFQKLEEFGRNLGIKEVLSGKLVRSSYHADEVQDRLRKLP